MDLARLWTRLMSHIGNLGHSAILLPAALVLCGFLLWSDRRADARALIAAIGVCLAATLIAKIAFFACESRVFLPEIRSPSGHASFSTTFYGCLALIVAAGRPSWQRALVYAGTALFVLLIGASRIVVEAHTLTDVWAGAAIGAVSVLVFQALRGPPRRLAVPFVALAFGVPVGAVLISIILLFARHWTPEARIDAAALRLDRWLNICGPRS
jgi:membrane-associated phospholipid phosphatase